MASDRLVTPGHVLKSVMEHERCGSKKALSALEQLEPDLAEYLMESLTRLYYQLTHLGLSGRDARKAHQLAERTALVCIMALHQAHRDLWQQDSGDAETPPPADPPPAP